jgi:hypothetical protein
MVEQPPWLATEFTRVRLLAAPVAERLPEQHGEMEGRLAKLTVGGDGRCNGEIWLATNPTEVVSSCAMTAL